MLCTFNPSLVRLAPGGDGGRRGPGGLSIPAWFDWRSVLFAGDPEERLAFNPSLVRLAPIPSWAIRLSATPFQSQLGSIGATFCRARVHTSWGFQSQLGSIGACGKRMHRCCIGMLSIPAWFDWRLIPPAHLHICNLLSIPAWFDWRCAASAMSSPVSVLSIPAWFDWRGYVVRAAPASGSTFNPSLVRLAHAMVSLHAQAPSTFNPSLVRLARRYRKPPSR